MADPAIDSTFKYIFTGSHKELLEDALNSILFPYSPELSDIKIINGEVVKPGQTQNKGTIRAYIGCSAIFKKENIILGIEMQIGKTGNFTERLLNYNAGLRCRNNLKTTWTIGLFIKASKNGVNNSSLTKLNKTQNGIKNELDLLDISEVDLYSLVKKINKNEEIYINGKKIGIRGKEWIKLLSLRTWCPQDFGKFVLPKNYILSNNQLLNTAIKILGEIPYDIISYSIDAEKSLQEYYDDLEKAEMKGEMKGKIQSLIMSSFELYCNNCDMKFIKIILGNKKFKKDDVDLYLKEYHKTNLSLVKNFVEFLKSNKNLSD